MKSLNKLGSEMVSTGKVLSQVWRAFYATWFWPMVKALFSPKNLSAATELISLERAAIFSPPTCWIGYNWLEFHPETLEPYCERVRGGWSSNHCCNSLEGSEFA